MGPQTPITPTTDWRELLANPGERDHTVQLYADVGFLARSVSHYAATGLARGDAVVFVATPSHRQAFAAGLARAGCDVESLTAAGQLTVLDAAETLAQFMAGGVPERGRFVPLIGGILDRAAGGGRFPRVRAYGEMVNLLWDRGELAAALQLEDLWNELQQSRAFSLHCAYAMDAFDRATCCGPLHGVHHAHSHLIPVEDYGRYDTAVSRALSDVLGPAEAHVLRSVLVARHRGGSQMPDAQAAVLGLTQVLPTAADAVLRRARGYYQSVPSTRA